MKGHKKPAVILNTFNEKAVTLQDIADYCEVSKWTAAAALRHDPRVKPTTSDRILAAAAQMGYDPSLHQAARRLALRKHGRDVLSHVIAILMPPYFFEANYFTEVFRGILRVLTPAQFGLLTFYAQGDEKNMQASFPHSITRGEVDGLILMVGPYHTNMVIEHLRKTGFGERPIASLIWEVPRCTSIMADDQRAGYLAAKHLLEQGHRHLLHFTFTQLPGDPETNRKAGMVQACKEYGLDPSAHLHPYGVLGAWLDPEAKTRFPDWDAKERENFLRTLRTHPEITAILPLNDPSAIHTWYTLQQEGIRVPDEMSIIGFDDTDPMLDQHGCNQLTTVRLPLKEIGRTAAESLISQITKNERPATPVVLPTELIVRGSTTSPCR
ncbi:MAG: LacI family DNA-binding transcriptional regulator [Armatimonadota bacterium]